MGVNVKASDAQRLDKEATRRSLRRREGAAGRVNLAGRINLALMVEILVVLAWAAMAYQTLQPNASVSSVSSEGLAMLNAAAEGPGAEWVGVYLQDQKIGAGLADTNRSKEGIHMQERTWIKLRAFEQDKEITTLFSAHLDPSEHLKSFRFVMNAPPSLLDVQGEVKGLRLLLTLRNGDEEPRTQTVELKEVPEVSLTFKERIAARHPNVGDVIELPYFDPATLSNQLMQARIVGKGQVQLDGKPIGTLSLETSFHGVTNTSIITEDGRTLEESNALGMKLKRESREQAMSGGWKQGAPAVDVIALSAVPIDEPIRNARTTTKLDAQLSGGGVEVLLPRSGADRPGLVQVRVPPRETWQTYSIPLHDDRFKDALADSPVLQITHPRIVKAAQSVIGDVTSAEDAAARLSAWLHERLVKESVMGVPNALEILQTGKGDCNEHTTLFTALARSVGIPTRMAAGIVYSEEVTGSPAFYYHAWPEVYLGDWVPIDPTFGQFPADATHIKLVEGDMSDQLSLVRVVGNLKVEVRSYQ